MLMVLKPTEKIKDLASGKPAIMHSSAAAHSELPVQMACN